MYRLARRVHQYVSYTLMTRAFLCLLFLVLSGTGFASDLAREKRLAEQIVDAIFIGEPMYLDAEGHSFLGIYTEAETGRARGSVIILHGRGFHPDWEDVVHPLRTGLAERGWNTLSLQMPVLKKEARYYDYVPIFAEAFPRIDAGIRFLRENGAGPVVLIAHSCSVHMSMAWLEQGMDKDIDAYAGIGMGATDYGQPMDHPFPLEKLPFPVLDIFGGDDYPAVLRGAAGRLKRIHGAGNPLSRQIVIPGADHYFHETGKPLVEIIAAWLATLHR